MKRAWTLSIFLVRELFRTLAGVVPLAAALAFGIIAFEYGMDQAQFITVGGLGISGICLLTTLLLASHANRATSFLLVGRLHHRTELLAALVISGIAITTLLTLLITAANLAMGRLTLGFPSVLWILPTWLVLWLLAAALALPLSALVGRGGSHIACWVLLAVLLVVNDQKVKLQTVGLDWLVRASAILLWPVSTMLSRASADVHDRPFFVALALTLVCAAALFVLASQLFEDKDLLWTE
jgi:hypothetical protein